MRATIALVLIAGVACRANRAVDEEADAVDAEVLISNVVLDVTEPLPVDLLFVVDNSALMGGPQWALIEAFPHLLETLKEGNGGTLPDLRVGVISSDLGAGGYEIPSCVLGGDNARLNTPNKLLCDATPSDPWISHRDGVNNVPLGPVETIPRLSEAFSCIARVGTEGCGFEQPLEAARRAVDPSEAINPGFIRRAAVLGIIFLSDEDDCSAKDKTIFSPNDILPTDRLGPLTSFRCFEFGVVCDKNDRRARGDRVNCVPGGSHLYDVWSRYVDFFERLKPQGRLVTGVIAGPTSPVRVGRDGLKPRLESSCMLKKATPAIRLRSVVDGTSGEFASICETSFIPALTRLGSRINAARLRGCLDGVADTSPAPGLQPECFVEMMINSSEVQIPRCSADAGYAPRPCWRVVADEGCNAAARIETDHDATSTLGPIRAVCVGKNP